MIPVATTNTLARDVALIGSFAHRGYLSSFAANVALERVGARHKKSCQADQDIEVVCRKQLPIRLSGAIFPLI